MISLDYINPIDNFNYVTYVYDIPEIGDAFDANDTTFIITDIIKIDDTTYNIKVKIL